MAKRTKIRSYKQQIVYLHKYMKQNKEFAQGEKNPVTMQGEWAKLRDELNTLGPKRTLEQWKTCWRDQKRKMKKERTLKSINSTTSRGNNMGDDINLGLSEDSIEIVKEEADSDLEDTVWVSQATPLTPQHRTSSISSNSLNDHLQEDNFQSPENGRQARRPTLRRKIHVNHLPHRLLNAQLQLNGLMRELVKEVRRSNILREKRIRLLMQETRQSNT